MRAEKKLLTQEYMARLNSSPFFVLVDYRGLNVPQFGELRKRLREVGAELHVVKNTMFRVAAREAAGIDLSGALTGQMAAVTGQRDISQAAKVLKKYQGEAKKPKVQFGYLGNQRLGQGELEVLADLPPVEVLRGRLLGALQAPATQLLRLLSTPAGQLARVLQARADKAGEGTPA
jgi:large subunit ribosomal protein L10